MNTLLDGAENAKDAMDTAITSVATKAMGGGTATSVIGWMSSSEGVATLGFVLTLVGFIINLVFQLRRDKREQDLQKHQIDRLNFWPQQPKFEPGVTEGSKEL
jgi:mannose/fructose/N-acetylgalactosamine-specific phosphotransferase system component IIC